MATECFTIEKFPAGYGWRLRNRGHGVIGVSTEVFETRDDAVRDAEPVRRFTVPAPIEDRTGEPPPTAPIDLTQLERERIS